MNKTFLAVLVVLCLGASWWMKKNAKGHLTELKDFWWIPIPLAIILLLIVIRQDNKSKN
jgi:hypothetical protein